MISNKNFKFGLVWPLFWQLTLFHFETVHFKLALAHMTWRRFWTKFTYGFFLHHRALVGICRWHGRLCLQCSSGFWKYSWAPLVMSMTESCQRVMQCSKGPKITSIQQRSSALSLTHRDFSSFSESFYDVMHCRWWDVQSLCRNVVLKVFHIFLRALSQIVEPLPIFTSERLCLSKTSLLYYRPDAN